MSKEMTLSFDEWEQLYKGRFKELQQKIQVGIEADERGEMLEELIREMLVLLV